MKELELLKREVRQIIGERYSLGSPAKQGKVYDIWVKYYWKMPFWPGPAATWKHTSRSPEFCRILKIAENKWQYKFEDYDPSVLWLPTWLRDLDYDEPVLTIEKEAGKLKITLTDYEGETVADIGIGRITLWEKVGGKDRRGVGETKEVTLEEAPEVEPTVPEEKPWWERLPWWFWPVTIGGGFGLLALYVLRKTK